MATSTAQLLPPELLLTIYQLLSPGDFDATRRACRHWLRCSKDLRTLRAMVKRGGWSSAESPVHHNTEIDRLSARIALESTLPANLVQCRITDATGLSSADYSPKTEPFCGLGFTTSICGYFALISEGCTIYVYRLGTSGMQPVNAVICPRRVLATCMDASARRYTVAALLDDRMGIVCDLERHPECEVPSPSVYSKRASDTDGLPSHSWENAARNAVGSIHVRAPGQMVSLLNASRLPPAQGHVAPIVSGPPSLLVTDSARHYSSMVLSSRLPPTTPNSQSIYASSAPLSVYHSLCAPDDPPRSVAVCPTRRCVAFGCAAGIELHWIDSLSGRNLMKWFPLSASSDCLHFLPSRPGIDNPNKLRLISSKAGMGQRCGTNKFARRGATFHRKSVGRYFGSTAWWDSRSSRAGEADYDHHLAIPLSDGFHILFTDPPTGTLCLGSDAPVGGPTKLLRKIQFVTPSGVDATSKGNPSIIYAAGRDLEYGVRIVAVYSSHLVFYSVPPDILGDISRVNGHLIPDAEQEGDHWSRWMREMPQVPTCLPIQIQGYIIGQLNAVVDVSILGGREPVIWTLSADGLVKTWQVCDVGRQQMERHTIDRNGAVTNVLDGDADWIMHEATSSVEPHPPFRRPQRSDVDMFDAPATIFAEADGDEEMVDPFAGPVLTNQVVRDRAGHQCIRDPLVPLDGTAEEAGSRFYGRRRDSGVFVYVGHEQEDPLRTCE